MRKNVTFYYNFITLEKKCGAGRQADTASYIFDTTYIYL